MSARKTDARPAPLLPTPEEEAAGRIREDEQRCRRVENALYRRARGYRMAVKKTYKVKRVEYDPDTGKKTCEREELQTGLDEVHVPADVRAGAYYLNNRDPARWREHPRPDGELPVGRDAEPGGCVELPDTADPDAEEDDLSGDPAEREEGCGLLSSGALT